MFTASPKSSFASYLFGEYILRPLGLPRRACEPVSRPEIDVDSFVRLHRPSFETSIALQKQHIASSQADIKRLRQRCDAAQFKQWAALGTLLPAVGFLATSYAMMFTFPFIVPGAILFVVTSVSIAVLIGFEERARSAYNEAHSEWQKASGELQVWQASVQMLNKVFFETRAQVALQSAPTASVAAAAKSQPATTRPASPLHPMPQTDKVSAIFGERILNSIPSLGDFGWHAGVSSEAESDDELPADEEQSALPAAAPSTSDASA